MLRKSLSHKHMSPSLWELVRQVRSLLQALGGRQTLAARAALVTALPHPLSPTPAADIPGGRDPVVPRLARDLAPHRMPLLALATPQLTLSGALGPAQPGAAAWPLPVAAPPTTSASSGLLPPPATPATPLLERVTVPIHTAPPPSGDTWHLHLAAPLDEDTVRNDLIPLLDRLRETG